MYFEVLSTTDFGLSRRLQELLTGQISGRLQVYEDEIKNGTVIAVPVEFTLSHDGNQQTIGRHPRYDIFWKPLIDQVAPGAYGKYPTSHIVASLTGCELDTRIGKITIRVTNYYQVRK